MSNKEERGTEEAAESLKPEEVQAADFIGASSIRMDTAADQLLVYQGPPSRPSFLCAVDNSGGYNSHQDCYQYLESSVATTDGHRAAYGTSLKQAAEVLASGVRQ